MITVTFTPDVAKAMNDAAFAAFIGERATNIPASLLATGIEALKEAMVTPASEWCPVCHTYHVKPGEKTDAGKLTRRCPIIPEDDPRNIFENYP